jgi:hypothetical protein
VFINFKAVAHVSEQILRSTGRDAAMTLFYYNIGAEAASRDCYGSGGRRETFSTFAGKYRL